MEHKACDLCVSASGVLITLFTCTQLRCSENRGESSEDFSQNITISHQHWAVGTLTSMSSKTGPFEQPLVALLAAKYWPVLVGIAMKMKEMRRILSPPFVAPIVFFRQEVTPLIIRSHFRCTL